MMGFAALYPSYESYEIGVRRSPHERSDMQQ